MTNATLAIDSRELALDVFDILRELDPSRWSGELAETAQARLDELALRIDELSPRIDELLELPSATDLLHRAQLDADASIASLRTSWARVAAVIEGRMPAPSLGSAELEAELMTFRAQLQGAYEGLANDLRDYAIHLPHLRPTNYARNVVHVAGAVISIAVVLSLFTPHPTLVLLIAASMASWAWFMETTRRFWPFMDRITWWAFGKCAHPHERYRINSATWFSTSLLLLALIGSPLLAVVALAVLGFADPSAAIVGRRWGRIKLLHGRSLEGSLTFLVVGFLASLAIVLGFFPALGLAQAAAVSLGAAGLGAVAEAVAKRIDDNLMVPMAAAAGAAAVSFLLGVVL
jgi:dolichol kinase